MVTALTNFTEYNANGIPVDTVGSQVGSLTVGNGSNQQDGSSGWA